LRCFFGRFNSFKIHKISLNALCFDTSLNRHFTDQRILTLALS
jgi:hypothetical protein